MKHIVFAGILLAGLPGVFASCQNKQSKPPETADFIVNVVAGMGETPEPGHEGHSH